MERNAEVYVNILERILVLAEDAVRKLARIAELKEPTGVSVSLSRTIVDEVGTRPDKSLDHTA